MKLHIFKHLHKGESSGGEPDEPDISQTLEAVEQSRLALEVAQEHKRRAEQIAARAKKIEQRNGFGQLLDKLTDPRPTARESGRNLKHGHGHTA
jgi:hypothetical protein